MKPKSHGCVKLNIDHTSNNRVSHIRKLNNNPTKKSDRVLILFSLWIFFVRICDSVIVLFELELREIG